ncbi:MAG: hypothetical protein V4641_01915 [Pseudomonadota bacterium]
MEQSTINVLIPIVAALISGLIGMLWGRIEEQRKEIAALTITIARDYVSVVEMKEFMTEVRENYRYIRDSLDEKSGRRRGEGGHV